MKKALAILATIVAAVAFAQADGTIIRRRDLLGGASSTLPTDLQTTIADLNVFVCDHNNPDAGGGTPNPCTVVGNDNNACTTLSFPCKTIQGGVNKVPKKYRHSVTVSVGPGNYKGANVSGFSPDFLMDAGVTDFIRPATVVIQGTMALATGLGDTPTGTVTSATELIRGANTSTVQATMTDGSKVWTPGVLRGKLIELTVGTNVTAYPIVTNTNTVITITGPWNTVGIAFAFLGGGLLPVGGSSTYRILDHATNVNTAILVSDSGPLGYGNFVSASAPVTTRVGFMFHNSAIGRGSLPFMGIDKIRISGADISTAGIMLSNGSLGIYRSRFEVNAGFGQILVLGDGPGVETAGNYHVTSDTTLFYRITSVGGMGRNVIISSSIFDGCGGSACLRLEVGGRLVLGHNDFRPGASANWNPIANSVGELNFSDNFVDCITPSTRTAINLNGAGAGLSRALSVLQISGNTISNCNTVINDTGYGYVKSGGNRNSGTGNNAVYRASNGAVIEADRLDAVTDGGSGFNLHDTITSIVATNEVVIDTSKTYSFAQIDSLSTDGGVLEKAVTDLRSSTLVRQTPQ